MSISDSIDDFSSDLDPAIREAVDGVTNRFGADGLAQMIGYAQARLAEARAALEDLAESLDTGPAS